MDNKEIPRCPHCNVEMKRWKTPDYSTWNFFWHWVCFNDECPYYVRGWDWMMASHSVKA